MPKIIVKSRGERFRRAGLSFTREGVELDTAKLKKGVFEQLEAEPQLVIKPAEKAASTETAAERKAREKAEAEADAKKAEEEAMQIAANAGANDQGGKA